MAGIEEAFEKFVTRVSSREEPQDEYGDPQTGEKRIPLMQGIKRGYDFENTMPNYYNQRYDYENEMPIYQDDRYNIPQQELMGGGVASMFRERLGYQEGGSLPTSVTAPSGIDYELFYSPFSGKPLYRPKYDPSRTDLVYSGTDPEEFFRTVMTTGVSTPTTTEIPTVDPFSGQPVSAQDQMAFAQPQADIFPQQNIPQPPSPVDQFIAERKFQSEADAAARSGVPFTKKIQDFIGDLYSGPQIAEMQERTFGTSGLPGATGIVSDLRHATAASQVRDKIADAVSMGYFNPAGLIPQSLGLFGSQVLGAANEIQSIRPNMQSMRDIAEDLRANFLGAVQVPYGQTASATYNQLLNNPTIAAQRSQQEAAARVTPTRMAGGGLTTTIPPVSGPDPQGVESLFRRRYN